MTNAGGSRDVALAEAIATWTHFGHVDKNGRDYIEHPRAVFYRIFADDAEDYDGQVVAWLHDVCEDTETTFRDLRTFFRFPIIEALNAITFRGGSKKIFQPNDKEFYPSETRDEYYERLKANPIALRVKLHDIAHNTSPKRMARLDPETYARLEVKYAHALEVLNA